MKRIFLIILFFISIGCNAQHDLPFGGRVGDTNSVWVDSISVVNDSIVFNTSEGEYKIDHSPILLFIEYGLDIGQRNWTITDWNKDADTLEIEVNDTMYFHIVGDSSLYFPTREQITSPSTLIDAGGGFVLFSDTTETSKIYQSVDSLIINTEGWKFKIIH